MNRKAIYAAAALLLLFSACELLGPESGADSGPEGKAAVRVAIAASGALARTVFPVVELADAKDWELWGGEPEGDQTKITELSGTSETVYLETGVWDFTVKGSNEAGAVILQGTLPNQTISLEETITLNFKVAPVSEEGTGTVKITIELPEGHGITKAKVWKDDAPIEGELAPDDDTVVFEENYPAGDYYFIVRLYNKDAVQYGVVSETAQVRANLTSAKTYKLSAADLNIIYSISYDLDEGALDSPNPDYYRSTDAVFELPEPTRKGYEFEGWHAETIEGAVVADIPQGTTGDKHFYAKWTAIAYPIKYVVYGGDNDKKNPDTYTIEGPAITLLDPSHDTREFQGWYTDPGFNEADAADGIPQGSTGDKHFYAKWNPQVTVGITLPVSSDPELSHKSIFEEEDAEFSAAGDGYESWQWRWDGKIIEDAESAAYTLAAGLKTPGVHELSVVVTTSSGEKLSARCKVTIKEGTE